METLRVLAEFGKDAGARLRQVRREKGWSMDEAAHRLDITEKTLGTWERAEADPGRRNRWPKIEEVYGVTRAEILGEPEPAQLERIESDLVDQRQMLEALLDSLRPNWRELLRPPEGLMPPGEDDPHNDEDPDPPETPAEDDPPHRS